MSSIFSLVNNYSTTLSSPMTTSQLTIPVNSIMTRDKTPVALTTALMGTGWTLTVDPGTSSEEFINVIAVAAGSGTGGVFTVAPTGRGQAYSGPGDSQRAGNAKTHNPGAVVILSDPKNLFDDLVNVESDQTVDGVKTFLQSPQVPTPISSELDAAASVRYVNETTTQGAPNAAVGVKGIVEIGTQAQVNTGDDSGSTNATSVVIPSTHLQTWGLVVTTDYTYGDTITAGQVLFLDTATAKWKLADASALATCDGTLGVALDSGVDTDTGKRVQIGGVVTGLTVTAGWVYVSDTAGAYSATPGTIKKVVGYAANATSLVLIDPIAAEQLTGGSSDLTTASLNRAGTFFKAPLKQGIITTLTAGQDLAAGDIVAIESDGKGYRVRPTGFSTNNAGAETNLTNSQLGDIGKMRTFDSPSSPIVKAFLGQETFTNPYTLRVLRITTDGDFNAVSSTGASSLDFGDLLTQQDAVQFHSDKIATCNAVGVFPFETLQIACCENVFSTPAFGSAITLETVGVRGAGVADTSTTDVLVAFGSDSTQVKSYKVTNSGSSLTESTNSTFLSGTALTVLGAKRFTGTDFIAVAYHDPAGSGSINVAVGEYTPSSGTWVSVGTPVVISSTGLTADARVMIEPISSTKIAVAYQQNSDHDFSAVVLTRSGTTPSIGSPLTVGPGLATTNVPLTFKQLGVASYFIGVAGVTGGKLQIIALDRDQTVFTAVGTILTNDSVASRGITGCMLYPDRWLAIYQATPSATRINTREWSTNLDSASGVAVVAIDTDATGSIITDGYTNSLSGLTAGVGYYTGIDGQPTQYSYGAMPFLNNSSGSPLVRRAYVALSATEGIVKL